MAVLVKGTKESANSAFKIRVDVALKENQWQEYLMNFHPLSR